MRDIILSLDRFGDHALLLGRVGENRATRVLIDIKSILSQYPDAIASITVKLPGRAEYPATVKQKDGILTWEITRADIGDKTGRGQAQITIQNADGTVIKTAIACTRASASLLATQLPQRPIRLKHGSTKRLARWPTLNGRETPRRQLRMKYSGGWTTATL